MGTVKANEGSAINLPINFALFEYLSDSANLDTIIFARPEDKNSALLAENVIHGDVASANKWKIKADPVDDSGATIYKSFTSAIGNMKNGVMMSRWKYQVGIMQALLAALWTKTQVLL